MKILTIFLALFLTWLPESAPMVPISNGQEVCTEEVCDVEEEAVIQTSRQEQKKAPLPAESLPVSSCIEPVSTESCYPDHPGSERHWLTCRKLRL